MDEHPQNIRRAEMCDLESGREVEWSFHLGVRLPSGVQAGFAPTV